MTDILADVDAMSDVETRHLGDWTPAQIIDHVRRLIRVSHSGARFKVPLPIRVMARLMKSRVLSSPMKPGLQTVPDLEPPAEISLDDAVAAFREEIRVARQPGAMSRPSPLLGPMTHEQWEQVHCRHAEHHFGFIVPS